MMRARKTPWFASAAATIAAVFPSPACPITSSGNSTTDIPLRAIGEQVAPTRFGTLNPTDGGRAQRASLSLQYHLTMGEGQLEASSFFIYNQLHLYSDFTHYLVDAVHGDQEDQFENRHVYGGAVNYTLPVQLGSLDSEVLAGALARYDRLGVGAPASEDREPSSPQNVPPSFSDLDRVYLFSGGLYAQMTTRWTRRFRSVLGLREDYQHGTDVEIWPSCTKRPAIPTLARQHSHCRSPRPV